MKLSRAEKDKKRALDQARREGTVPPEVDEEGNAINPHIPEFMASAPWYLGQDMKGLQHQRKSSSTTAVAAGKQQPPASIGTWYNRGSKTLVQAPPAATVAAPSSSEKQQSSSSKIVKGGSDWKGGCKNCGSKTHDAKDCMERPRKVGAWKTGQDIKPDEAPQIKLSLSYDGARDRWNGFDPSEQLRIIKLRQKAEEERKLKKREEKKKRKREEMSESDSDDSSASSGSGSSSSSPSKPGAKKTHIVPAGLRTREDTAKYLYNLDPDSAFYDPKTRSMRANPLPGAEPDKSEFAGDNFVKDSGESAALTQSMLFSLSGASVAGGGAIVPGNILADPTSVLLAEKQFRERKEKLEAEKKRLMVERYAPESSTVAPDLIFGGQTENYVEYSADGRQIVKGKEAVTQIAVSSKYPEDVLEGNHTAIWGSYFDRETLQWGYDCCWSTNRRSYCTGKNGKLSVINAHDFRLGQQVPASSTSAT